MKTEISVKVVLEKVVAEQITLEENPPCHEKVVKKRALCSVEKQSVCYMHMENGS